MPFIKVVKTKAYSKRFQTKFKRRRECKTDYYARARMCVQDKNKYNTPKHRLVVRVSNKQITAQIAYATIKSDRIVAAAYSSELSRFGAISDKKSGGQKNYAAAYATGYLLARRVLQKLGIDKSYTGVEKADGNFYRVKAPNEDARKPFKVFLDVGLARTTTGSRIFGAMKGALDGGLDIPHKPKRFPANKQQPKKFDPKVLRKYIYGGHISDYMKQLQAKNPTKYQSQFARYVKSGKGPEDVEKMWAGVHSKIKENPAHVKVVRQKAPVHKRHQQLKRNNKQRKDRIRQKLASAQKPTNV